MPAPDTHTPDNPRDAGTHTSPRTPGPDTLRGEVVPDDAPVQQEETCEQLREDLARARADFINYRRRTESLATRRALEATAELAGELLPVFDALDLAPAAAADDPVFRLLIASLTRAGLTSFGAIGEIFDPTKHDAVAATHSEDTPIVLRVLRSGYQWNEVLLRPAMVEVG